jgi:DNA-binding winged helix-turn-helix (wHTH) protein
VQFRVADWSVDPASNRIADSGGIVRLEPKAMDVLVYMARHAGRVVSRDELMKVVWDGTVVGDDTLTAAIQKLRKAFGDDSRHPRIIETIPKRGYRLIARVNEPCVAAEAEAEPASAAFGLNRASLSGLRRGWPAWSRPTVAIVSILLVLLLGLISYGLLRWTLSPSVQPEAGDFSTDPVTSSDADRLDSGHVVSAPVVSASDATVEPRGPPGVPTETAYELYQQGIGALAEGSRERVRLARSLLQRAVRADPAFARAHAALADTFAVEVAEGWADDRSALILDGLDSAERAVALNPQLPAAHLALARLQREAAALDRARDAARSAIALDPSDPEGRLVLASILTYLGDPAQARAHYDLIRHLRPLDKARDLLYQGQAAFTLASYPAAIRLLEAGLARDAASQPLRIWLAAAYANAGRIDDAQWQIIEAQMAQLDLSLSRVARTVPYRREVDRDRLLDGLRAAGLPE